MSNAQQKAYVEKGIGKDRCVALGEDIELADAEAAEIIPAPDKVPTLEERVANLEQMLSHLTLSLDSLYEMFKPIRNRLQGKVDHAVNNKFREVKSENKIPEGTILTGKSKGLSYYLTVRDGGFYIGDVKHGSLSAAAEKVSGVRRSGLTFWHFTDGKTVKEKFSE